MKTAPNIIVLLVFVLVQLSVFIALLIVSEKMIKLSGGWTSLANLTMGQRTRFAWQVIWRLLTVFLVAVVFAVATGVNKHAAATLWVGFDGLAFPWRQGALQIWIAFIAIITFVFVLEKGTGNEARFGGVVRQLRIHRSALLFSWAYLGLFLMGTTFIQSKLALMLGAFLDNGKLGTVGTYLLIGFIVLFSYLRIWVIVAILTYSIRASYRRLGAQEVKP
ncbi:hypothetical protein FVA81_02490 (plasmid) [Rhizobium sp. WL3]|uniref:hypothetical protein n=1 Tax=Rhizobium sp. WL3 TaxID=2603277 RepID=UPI0011C1E7F2|nr:hypothetical protein [Rhizobium sp. WL3]QEE43522.1 hypothetical protein FVA81_02490 [Rhizobium sp. WL3]